MGITKQASLSYLFAKDLIGCDKKLCYSCDEWVDDELVHMTANDDKELVPICDNCQVRV